MYSVVASLPPLMYSVLSYTEGKLKLNAEETRVGYDVPLAERGKRSSGGLGMGPTGADWLGKLAAVGWGLEWRAVATYGGRECHNRSASPLQILRRPSSRNATNYHQRKALQSSLNSCEQNNKKYTHTHTRTVVMSQSQLPFSKSASPSDIPALLASWAGNLQRNTADVFQKLHPADYVRLITIICGYLLLRPYLIKVGAHVQEKEHARKNEPAAIGSGEDGSGSGGYVSKHLDSSPQQQRTKPAIPGVDSDSEGEDGEAADGADWGRRARLRQRKIVREALAKHERQLQEMQQTESDKEIDDLLIDDQ